MESNPCEPARPQATEAALGTSFPALWLSLMCGNSPEEEWGSPVLVSP